MSVLEKIVQAEKDAKALLVKTREENTELLTKTNEELATLRTKNAQDIAKQANEKRCNYGTDCPKFRE